MTDPEATQIDTNETRPHFLIRARPVRNFRTIRIGTMDLKIASMALAHDATLVSANLRDFKKVPGLRVEDWLGN